MTCKRCIEHQGLRDLWAGKRKSVDLDGSREAYNSYCPPCVKEFNVWLRLADKNP